ncbi:MAG TPA: adenylate cyclase [Cytophagales bacterium]|nr:adenylate cyclase [Cytophagales bacterium]
MLDNTYRLQSHYCVVPISDTQVMLTSETDGQILEHPIAVKFLAQLAEGPFKLSDWYADGLSDVPIGEAMVVLHQLEQEGFITQQPGRFSPEQEAYWKSLGYNVVELAERLKSFSLEIKSLDGVNADHWALACQQTGMEVQAEGDLTLVIAADYQDPQLAVLNQEFLAAKRPWLLIKPTGTEVWIGPLFDPRHEDSACWECLNHRLRLHDHKGKYYRGQIGKDQRLPRPHVHHPMSEQMATSVTMHLVVDYLLQPANSEIKNGLVSIDMRDGKREHHALVKRPQCTACGDAAILSAPPKPPILSSPQQLKNRQGGYRSVAAEETLAQYQHHVSAITGIAPYLEKYNPLPGSPVHNYGSGRNMAMQSTSLFWLNMHLRSANGGKGKTEIQGKVGALCEAIERYSLMYKGTGYTKKGTLNTIEDALHPNELMLFSEYQFDHRDAANLEGYKFYALIPRRIGEDEEVEWTPVYSLTQKKFKYLPTAFCYAQYPAGDEKHLFSYPDSNGCAAGNTLEEAILQGYLELIERDAAAIWFYNRIPRPTVDLASLDNPYLEEVQAYYKEIDRTLYVLDLTTDFGVPVFVAVTHNLKEGPDEILYAFGAHVEAAIALERAIIEVNQLLPIVKTKEGGYLTKDPDFVSWLTEVRIEDAPYLAPNGELKQFPEDYPALCPPTISDAVQCCIQAADQIGLETLVLDLTQPDIGLPVAKVMVPGMRHFWRRTAPGRLYEVPVKLGWLAQPYREEELNPLSIFI